MNRITYWLFRGAILLFSILPFRVIYWLSDGLAFLLHRVIRYRYRVTLTNIQKSFPNKSEQEIQAIIKGSYQNLADIIVESLKGYTLTTEELIQRFKITYPPSLKTYLEESRSVMVVAGHYANWEWGAFCGGLQTPKLVLCYYKPIKNKFIDAYYRKHLEGRNMINVPMKSAARAFMKNKNKPLIHLLVADQSPTIRNKAIWIDFLNQDTACLNGVEKLAIKFDYPVFFMHFIRKKRGWYDVQLEEIFANPKETQPSEITKGFMKTLEQDIVHKPEDWLWSHRRWKKQRN